MPHAKRVYKFVARKRVEARRDLALIINISFSIGLGENKS